MFDEIKETSQKQPSEAYVRMRMLKIDYLVIRDFLGDGLVYYSENQNKDFQATLHCVKDNPKIASKIEEFNKKWDALVYHAQLSHTEMGDLWSLFYVSAHEEEWDSDKNDLEDGVPMIYCYNETEELFSEFGRIGIESHSGGVLRTA